MVLGLIRKTMKGAIENLSKREAIEKTSISLFIHTKDEDHTPKYMYAINGKIKRNEDNSVIDLDFKKDILNVKIDMMNRKDIAANFLRGYFNTTSEFEKIPATDIYIRIDAVDEELSELVLGLYNKGTLIRPLQLEDIFGD